MINPVAPFYEFYLQLIGHLPPAFIAFVSIGFVCYFVLALLQLFWSTR